MASSPIGCVLGGILSPAAGGQVPQAGNCVVDLGGQVWVSWAQGNSYTGHLIGVVVTAPNAPGSPMQVMVSGTIPWAAFNLGPGNPSYVSAGLSPYRSLNNSAIGYCDPAGTVTLVPAYVGGPKWFPAVANTGLVHVTNGNTDTSAWPFESGGAGDQLLVTNPGGTDVISVTVIKDLFYTDGAFTVIGIQGNSVASTAPVDGQAYIWNAGASQWQPTNPGIYRTQSVSGAGSITAKTGSVVFVNASGGSCPVTPPTVAAGVQWGISDINPESFTATNCASIVNAGGNVEDPLHHGVYSTNPIPCNSPGMTARWMGDPTGTYYKAM